MLKLSEFKGFTKGWIICNRTSWFHVLEEPYRSREYYHVPGKLSVNTLWVDKPVITGNRKRRSLCIQLIGDQN